MYCGRKQKGFMKKMFLITALLLGINVVLAGQYKRDFVKGPGIEERIDGFLKNKFKYPQEILVFGTNSNQDGYITGGYMLGQWGFYAGLPIQEKSIVNQSNGSVSSSMRFGVMTPIHPNRLLFGIGAQPTSDGTKLNSFVGLNPLNSKDMKFWMIGNVTGSIFSFGAGLSYRVN